LRFQKKKIKSPLDPVGGYQDYSGRALKKDAGFGGKKGKGWKKVQRYWRKRNDLTSKLTLSRVKIITKKKREDQPGTSSAYLGGIIGGK